jgi:nucleoside-diphosphate-sugar epimerase
LKYNYLPDAQPPIHEITGGPDSLNTSLKLFYDVIVSDEPKAQELLSYSNSWADVRDIALGHVLALQKEAAAGERIIICSGMGDFPSGICLTD